MIFENFNDDDKSTETIVTEDKQLLKDIIDELMLLAVALRESSTYGDFAIKAEEIGNFIDAMDAVSENSDVTSKNLIAKTREEMAN